MEPDGPDHALLYIVIEKTAHKHDIQDMNYADFGVTIKQTGDGAMNVL